MIKRSRLTTSTASQYNNLQLVDSLCAVFRCDIGYLSVPSEVAIDKFGAQGSAAASASANQSRICEECIEGMVCNSRGVNWESVETAPGLATFHHSLCSYLHSQLLEDHELVNDLPEMSAPGTLRGRSGR